MTMAHERRHDHGGMGGMGGMTMDMASDPIFRNYDMVLARRYWYLIAGAVGTMAIIRVINFIENWFRSVHQRKLYARCRILIVVTS